MDNTASPPPKKLKACDDCRRRRVICFPNASGPCPRCAKAGVPCTTTPTIRKVPVRKRKALPEDAVFNGAPTPTESLSALPSGSSSSSSSGVVTASVSPPLLLALSPCPVELSALLFPSPTLVYHLVELFFVHFPHATLPIMPSTVLQTALFASGWQPYALEPSLQTLTWCIMALAARISVDSTIVGPGAPNLDELRGGIDGTDSREWGLRRVNACRVLRGEARRLAKVNDTLIECSMTNAASCMLLDALESEDLAGVSSSTYGAVYASHLSRLACDWSPAVMERDGLRWSLFLMSDSINGLASGHGPRFSASQEQLISGPLRPTPSLEHFVEKMRQAHAPSFDIVSSQLGAYVTHVRILARQQHDQITGLHARRSPLNVTAVDSLLSSVRLLHTVLLRLLHLARLASPPSPSNRLFPYAPPPSPSPHPFATSSITAADLLPILTFLITTSWSALVLPLHQELRRRDAHGGTSNWIDKEQLKTPLEESTRLARIAARELSSCLTRMPSLPHVMALLPALAIPEWIVILAEEATETIIVDAGTAQALAGFSSTLEQVGFVSSHDYTTSLDLASFYISLATLPPPPPPSLPSITSATKDLLLIPSSKSHDFYPSSFDLLGGEVSKPLATNAPDENGLEFESEYFDLGKWMDKTLADVQVTA